MVKKIFKILGVFVCIIGLIIFAKISHNLIYSATSVTCLESKLEDSFNFGQALAINDNYIAVGDPGANRVTIYSYDELKGNWSRTREIYPPKYSIVDKVGYGFGNSLAFNKNQLIIGTYSEPQSDDLGKDVETEKNEFKNEYHGAVYSLLLDENNKNSFREIVLPQSVKLSGYAVTIFNNKIALGATTGKEPGEEPGKILIINPTTLQVEKTIEPPSLEQKLLDFGFVIDGNDDFLLVGSRGLTKQGRSLLIDHTGKIEQLPFIKDPTNPFPIASTFSIALTNDLIAVVSSTFGGDGNTLLLRRTLEKRSLEVVPFGGSLDATGSYVLISTAKEIGMPSSTFQLIHMLVKLEHNRVKIVSKIRWKWSPDFKFEAKGIIYNNRLLLSHKGKVVVLSMQHLPRNYVINKSFCKWK
jgi:hypothetical protein